MLSLVVIVVSLAALALLNLVSELKNCCVDGLSTVFVGAVVIIIFLAVFLFNNFFFFVECEFFLFIYFRFISIVLLLLHRIVDLTRC